MFHWPRIAIEAVPRPNWAGVSFGTWVVQVAGGAHFLSVHCLRNVNAAMLSGELMAIFLKSSVTTLPPALYRKLGTQRPPPSLCVNAYCCFLAATSLSQRSPNCCQVQALAMSLGGVTPMAWRASSR